MTDPIKNKPEPPSGPDKNSGKGANAGTSASAGAGEGAPPPAPPAEGHDFDQELRAIVKRSKRWSTVWIVPVIAFALAGWLVWEHYSAKGTLAQVRFETAESLTAGKTEVRCRSVRVGYVETVELTKDLHAVMVSLRIDPGSQKLLRPNTRFWVVRPRVSASAISGLGTLITGAYIEMDPGDGDEKLEIHHFTGLEAPPVTKSSVPGLRLVLSSENAGSLTAGSPIYFKGFEVGRVELRTFDIKEGRTKLDVFIREEYASLVYEGTCFWNTSGVDVTAGAQGFRIRTPSLQALVSGGASFAVPPDMPPGELAKNGTVFRLYPDEDAANDSVFKPTRRCLLFFDQSVRGLNKGAPVEFRGIPMGRVVDVSLKYSASGEARVPVLIELDLSVLRNASQAGANEDGLLADAVKHGLRAKLGTGSLLTGALFIDLDFVPNAPPMELTQVEDFDVIPTHSSGLVQLEAKITAILDKIEALHLDETLTKFGNAADAITTTVAEARGAISEAEKLLAREETQNLTAEMDHTLKEVRSSVSSLGPTGSVQGDLRRTLDELRLAIRSFKTLSDNVSDKPNSLIFGRENNGNPVPRAKRD